MRDGQDRLGLEQRGDARDRRRHFVVTPRAPQDVFLGDPRVQQARKRRAPVVVRARPAASACPAGHRRSAPACRAGRTATAGTAALRRPWCRRPRRRRCTAGAATAPDRRSARSAPPRVDDLLRWSSVNDLVMSHAGIVRAHLAQVASSSRCDRRRGSDRRRCRRCVLPVRRFGDRERLEDRARIGLAAAEVVDLAAARRLDERGDEARDVERVDVVADLLALVAEDRVLRGPRGCTSPGSCRKPCSSTPEWFGPGQAAAAQAAGRHAEVAAVLLHHHVGRDLRRAEQRVLRLVDRERLGDAVRERRVGVVPARLELRAAGSRSARRRRPCSWTCGRTATPGTPAAPLRAGSACRRRWCRSRRTESPPRDRATAARRCGR